MANQPKGDYREVNVSRVSNREVTENEMGRILPRQLSSGSTRGTQTVGYGDTKIDGSNNTITVGSSILLDGNNTVIEVTNEDGSSIGMGLIPDNTGRFGFYAKDSDGNIIMTIVDGTQITNDTQFDRVLLGKSVGGF